MTDLESRFHALWRRKLKAERSDEAFAILDAAYASPSRAYHSWRHIAALLQELDRVRDVPEFAASAFDEIELAIFFHDAVYDPLRNDNEAKSAALFQGLASEGTGSNPASLAPVTALIEATATHEAGSDPSAQLMLDLDLGILGAPSALYEAYVAEVRREFSHVPDALWTHGRGAVLDRFLARERIYQTAHFHARLEEAARANLSAERHRLLGA